MISQHQVDWKINVALTAAPGSPGGPGSPGKPTGPCREIETPRRLSLTQIFDITSTTALVADSSTEKYDTVMLLLTALIMHKSWLCVSVELTYRVTLGTIISRGSAATRGSSSSWWAGFSLLTSLSSWALGKNESQTCQPHIRAIHDTLTIAC